MIPVAILRAALQAADREVAEVFNHPSARGRFKEGMSIATGAYTKHLGTLLIDDMDAAALGLNREAVELAWEEACERSLSYAKVLNELLMMSDAGPLVAVIRAKHEAAMAERAWLGGIRRMQHEAERLASAIEVPARTE